MDFLALHRRDLQALCKRNGIRANMTNAAMADALRALPAIDGIEEYVKQPVAVPEPAVKAVAEVEEPRLQKQGSPLPRGRRVAAKSSEPITPNAAEEENATREPNKEDGPAIGVGRRGASRRARPAPVVPKLTGKASTEEEKQGSPLVGTRRVEDGEAEEDLKREADKENAPAPIVGRLGRSRRAQPAPAVESAGAGVGEGKREKEGSQDPRGRRVAVKSSEPIRPDDCEGTEKEDLKNQATTDDAPVLGMGLRGARRRARPAAPVAAPSGKAVAEEAQTARIPRGRRAEAKSTEPIKPNNGDEDEKDGTKPEEEADIPALGMGRRGAGQRTRRAPAVAALAAKVATDEKPKAAIPSGPGVSVKTTDVISLDDSEEEEEKDTKSEEKDEDMPTIGLGRRGASRRAPAPVQAPATRRMAAASKTEAEGVAMEAVPIRPTRQRKPTMKAAAAAAEEKAPLRAPRRGAVRKTVLKLGEQEEPQGVFPDAEAVPAPVSDQGCDSPGVPEKTSGPQNKEQNNVFDAPEQENKDMVVIEDETLTVEPTAEEPFVTNQECMDKSTRQEQQVDVETCPPLLDKQEESPILGTVLPDREEISEVDTEDDLVSQRENMNIDEFHTELVNETILFDCLDNINLVDEEETDEANTEDGLSCQQKGDVAVDTVPAGKADEAILLYCSDQNSKIVEEAVTVEEITGEIPQSSAALDEDGGETTFCTDTWDAGKQKEVASLDNIGEIAVEDGDVVQEKSAVITGDMPQSTAAVGEDNGEAYCLTEIHFDEQKELVTAEYEPEADVVEEKSAVITRDMPQSTTVVVEDEEEAYYPTEIHSDKHMEVVTAENEPEADVEVFQDERQQTTATADEVIGDDHVDTDFVCAKKQMEVVADDNVHEQSGTYCQVSAQENTAVVPEEMPQSTATMDEGINEDQFEAAAAGQAITANDEAVVEEETSLIIDEMQQITVTMNEDIVDDHFETGVIHADEQKLVVTTDEVPELTRTDGEIVEEGKAAMITKEVPKSTGTTDKYVKGQCKTDFIHADEQKKGVADDNVTEVRQTEDNVVQKENAFTDDLPQQLGLDEVSSDRITLALLDESLSKRVISLEPTKSVSEDTSVCKNSSEKNNTEPAAMQEEKGVNVAKKSLDLNKLSLGQLRTKLKERLNAKKNKDAKRVALARVDENVCRSHAKGQQQNLKLQLH